MKTNRRRSLTRVTTFAFVVALAAITVAGCGGSSKPSAATEAQSAATGDIPDNQVFLTFKNTAAGYSIKYPEGWSQKGGGSDVTISDKQNTIHAVVASGPAPTVASVKAELAKLKSSDPTIKLSSPQQLTMKGVPVIKVTYTRLGTPDPVTGKRLQIITDRYEYARTGKRAVLDLGTPKGVDNVDAYRMISQSFTWL
jgi:hypothetical protein